MRVLNIDMDVYYPHYMDKVFEEIDGIIDGWGKGLIYDHREITLLRNGSKIDREEKTGEKISVSDAEKYYATVMIKVPREKIELLEGYISKYLMETVYRLVDIAGDDRSVYAAMDMLAPGLQLVIVAISDMPMKGNVVAEITVEQKEREEE